MSESRQRSEIFIPQTVSGYDTQPGWSGMQGSTSVLSVEGNVRYDTGLRYEQITRGLGHILSDGTAAPPELLGKVADLMSSGVSVDPSARAALVRAGFNFPTGE